MRIYIEQTAKQENTMRKRIMAALLSVAICAAGVGCSGENDGGGTGLESPDSASAVDNTSDSEPEITPDTAPEQTDTPPETEQTEQTSDSEPPEETSEPEESFAGLILAYSNSFLGLPAEDRVYVFSDAYQTAEIDGAVCHAISCYDEFEGTLYYMCDFYISEDGARVYRFYESENRYQLLPEEQGYVRLDPTVQSADEIFEKARELEVIFTPYAGSAVLLDTENYIELDGLKYDLVTDERFSTKQKLLETLDKFFSMEIIGAMMETNAVAEQDGKIYVRHSDGAGGNPYLQSVEYELSVLTDNEAIFTEYDTYLYEAGETEVKEITYKAEKQYGMWRFTEYPMTNLWQ